MVKEGFGKVVDFGIEDQVYPLDFTLSNLELTTDLISDTDLFSEWVSQKLLKHGCRYGIGGYDEHRTIYSRSEHFNDSEEPRRLHLGIDIWAAAGTTVYACSDAIVHSFQFNDHFGDYGATIVLEHIFGESKFYILYGHLSLYSLDGLKEGLSIEKGTAFAQFGKQEENGHWPPHLHFQVIKDMEGFKGDYPGVCQYSKREAYLSNCPNPDFILNNTFKTMSF
ncbi:MAG: peptidoglycan DD-metalloendopeptidase family protein [Pedobacter sp.]